MPGCGENVDINLVVPLQSSGSFPDNMARPDTNKPFVRDMTYDELEELIEKCVRRVLQGEDIKREYERLKAEMKKR